jgi:hypothetical protein
MDTMNAASPHLIPSPSPLALLLCGNSANKHGDIYEVIHHLTSSIDTLADELNELPNLSDKKISFYGPFLGRSLLELGATALIARLDPFKLLLLREKQKQPNYQLDKPNKSSIRWQGDVLAEHVKDMWDDKALSSPTRALLGDYYMNLIWHKNYDSLIDTSASINGDQWLSELRLKGAQRLYSEIRTGFSSSYSTLSKGIHHELVVPISSSFDKETTKELIKNVIFHISTLGLITSLMSHSINQLPPQQAFDAYKSIQEMEILK